jgi:hypothetical protein
VFLVLSGFCGAWIYKSTSKDILDPRVRDRIRHEWSIELNNHNQAMERAKAEEQEWLEKKQRRELEEAERIKKEERERERMRLYWDDVQGDEQCTAHETRKYSARLANLLPGIDPIAACKATTFTSHNVTYDAPDYCEDRVSDVPFRINLSTILNSIDQGLFSGGTIYGHWVVKDPVCSTFWHLFSDKVS